MDYGGPDRRSADARLVALETTLRMHIASCERDGKATKETAERIEAKVDANGEKREAQHNENTQGLASLLAKINAMEKKQLYALLGIAGLLIWEYVVKRVYMG